VQHYVAAAEDVDLAAVVGAYLELGFYDGVVQLCARRAAAVDPADAAAAVLQRPDAARACQRCVRDVFGTWADGVTGRDGRCGAAGEGGTRNVLWVCAACAGRPAGTLCVCAVSNLP
jgi:hypothetical protein